MTVDLKKNVMKKSLLLALALLLTTAVFAQSRAIHLRETFDSASLPEGWTTTETGAENWVISETNNAGGEANELMLSPDPQAVGITRIITKPIDLTGMSSVTISFRHYFKKKSANAIIGIATSTNGNTWSSAWTHTYSEEGQYTVIENISNADMGKQNVKFCIYYQGNTNNMNGWYFDDFEIVTIENNDAKVESIDMHDILASGKIDIDFSVQNTGTNDITSFEAKYEVGGVTVTESFDANIAKFGIQKFSFEEKVYLQPASYTVKVTITSVNGTDDENTTNNTLTKALDIAVGGTQRIPMFEQFSSSTCANCGILNGNMKTLTDNNPGKFTYTKYAMNFPGTGDDYYTAEAGTRKNYYGVSYVPQLFFDGKDNEYNAVTQEELDARYTTPAFVNIKGAFDIEGSVINVKLDVMSYIDLNDVRLFVNANEKRTVENVEYHETEFFHIMMKMLSGTGGETISLNEYEVKHFEYSYDMAQTNVEELSDLEVAVWVQNYQTQEVFNSSFLYEYTDHAYPAQNLKLEKGNKINVSWEAPAQGTPSAYRLIVNGDIVKESNDMSYVIDDADGYYAVEVVALYEDGKESVGLFNTIGKTTISVEENEVSFGIYPNPVDDYLYISTNEDVKEIHIYNMLGMTVYQTTKYNGNSINVSELNNGMYLMKVITENGESVKRFIKK